MLGRLGNVIYWVGVALLVGTGLYAAFNIVFKYQDRSEALAVLGVAIIGALVGKALQYILGGKWELKAFINLINPQDNNRAEIPEQEILQKAIHDFRISPGHEHFDKVRNLMACLLQNGQAQDLAQAYEMAIWAHPEVRVHLLRRPISS